jgi:hypothetical protein
VSRADLGPRKASTCAHPGIVGGIRYRVRNGTIVKIDRQHTFRGVSERGPWEHTMWRGHILGTREILFWDMEGHYGANYCGHELDIVRRMPR